MARLLLVALAPFLLAAAPRAGQETLDLDGIARIRDEGFRRSRVMETLWFLTDLHGPRLTNSPQERAALRWAAERFEEFGLERVQLEPWGEFGLGWSFERCVVELVEPTYIPLIALPKAWTSGLEAPVRGVPVLVEAQSVEDLEKYRGTLAGRIVLNGRVEDVDSFWEPLARRYDEAGLAELYAAPLPEKATDDDRRGDREDWRSRRAVREALQKLLQEEGVAVVLEPDGGARKDYGVITLGGGGSRAPDEERALPQLVVATEHFNRVARLLQKGHEPVLAVDVRTTFHAEDLAGYNVVAELPGQDPALADQLVMLGAHFDSWHAATGATDNGASCAVVMEAARILKAIGAPVRRTVRFALWTGEEQGLLGSRGYVKQHFADPDDMVLKPEHGRLAAYFNLDNGGGRIRGIYLQENAACRPLFEAWFEPFHDLGAGTVTIRNTGGTDHQSFHAVGLPGFQFIQDPMDYSTRTHHTNMDLYERVHEGDVQQAAVILAAFAWQAATRDAMLPRRPLPEPRRRPEEAPAETPAAAPAAAGAPAGD